MKEKSRSYSVWWFYRNNWTFLQSILKAPLSHRQERCNNYINEYIRANGSWTTQLNRLRSKMTWMHCGFQGIRQPLSLPKSTKWLGVAGTGSVGENRQLAASPNGWLFPREGKLVQARKSRASQNSFSRYCILVFPPKVWHLTSQRRHHT